MMDISGKCTYPWHKFQIRGIKAMVTIHMFTEHKTSLSHDVRSEKINVKPRLLLHHYFAPRLRFESTNEDIFEKQVKRI
jgi:hypothetical protein